MFYKVYTIWVRSLIRVKRGCNVGYFFYTSRLQKHCTITLILKRSKVVSKIIGIDYSVTIINGKRRKCTGSYSFGEN